MSCINLHDAAWDARGARIIGSGDAIMLMHDGFAINFAEHVSDMETTTSALHRANARRWTLKKRWLTKAEKKSFSQNCYKVVASPLCPKRACRKNAVPDETKFPRFQCNWQKQLSFTTFYRISFLRWIINYWHWSRQTWWTFQMSGQVDWSLHERRLRPTNGSTHYHTNSDHFKWHPQMTMHVVLTSIELSRKAIEFNYHANASEDDYRPCRVTRFFDNFTWRTTVNASFPFISSMGDHFIRIPITPFLSSQRCWFTFVCRISLNILTAQSSEQMSYPTIIDKVVLPLFSNLFLFLLACLHISFAYLGRT